MAIINTKGVVANETNIISEAGQYLLKITKYEVDGYNNDGDEKYKVSFEGKKVVGDGKFSDEIYTMMDFLNPSEKTIWTIARLRDALKSPELFDLKDWVGRYVIAVVEMNEYNGKTNPRFKRLMYSKFNDKMPPIPEAQQVQEQSTVNEVPEVEVSLDEIPF